MAKDDEKYTWDWKTQTFPVIDPHSKVKHQIIRDYLQSYVQVLMRNALIPELRLSVVDGFCGGGQYDDIGGEAHFGSPLIALNAIREAEALINLKRTQPRIVRTQNFFVDVKQANIDCLRAVLASQNQGHRIDRDVFLQCSDFTQALPAITRRIKDFGYGERALFLLDQYAYGDVPFASIKAIFNSISNAEILLTFNVDALITYLADRKANRKAIANIGLEQHIPWSELSALKANQKHEWQYLIQRCLSKGILIESGAKFMTVFFITPHGANPRTYWFIHLANKYRANDVMKSIHWRHGNHFSHMLSPSLFVGYDANRDVHVTNQEDLLLGEEHHFDGVTHDRICTELSELLPQQLYAKREQTFGDLMHSMANYTMADEEVVKRSLHVAVANQDLEVRDKNGKARRRKGDSIMLSDIIIAPAQSTFFFL
ncbi:three-Cys-motif partner protein TcmP [Pseudomonas indica]|uniref:three-Cys-motif partner protein TcmP n=1 Tax=Pseudomonas indica TaxID=137658 RepID=UPI0023F980A1|nr:three-Cys-motif partner protein TcmP [Pseudomonas indica]MBU3059880.1 three-Cys-motif partner protein TcmP [Pseudomonas indica]